MRAPKARAARLAGGPGERGQGRRKASVRPAFLDGHEGRAAGSGRVRSAIVGTDWRGDKHLPKSLCGKEIDRAGRRG
jgi:hypothetical protein